MEQDSPNESMMQAIKKGDCESVKLLLEKGADVTYGGHQCSTLAVATSYGHQEIVELLLNKGAVVNYPNFGYSFALFLALFGGYRRIVQLLLKNGAIGNDDKWSPYEAALKGGHQDIVELLLNHKTNVNQESKGGITRLTLN